MIQQKQYKGEKIMTPYTYTYPTESGQTIHVWIEKDCGMVQGQHAPWHKVICRPVGVNNCPAMVVDFSLLRRPNEASRAE